jgi:hypothetical protein
MDGQLAGKGLKRVESGGDLIVGYQAGISQEKEFDNTGAGGGPGLFGWGNWGNTRVTTSTIDVGKIDRRAIRRRSQATGVARRRVQDTQYQQGPRQELSQPGERFDQAVRELSSRDG